MDPSPVLKTCLLTAAALCAAPAAHALVITFDGPGYTATGSTATVSGVNGAAIHGQGSPTTWFDSPTTPRFAVVANAGKGGDNNGLVSATSQTQFTTATYTPSLAELGVTGFDPGTRQDFSLDVRLINDGGFSSSTELYRLGIGAASASVFPVELRIRANGDIRVYMSNTLQFSMSGVLTEDGSYRTISGSIDYSTSQVTVFLDGSATPAGSFTFTGDYSSAGNDAGYGRFSLNVRQTSDTAGIALDNLSVSVSPVPEPATLTLAALATGLVFVRRPHGA